MFINDLKYFLKFFLRIEFLITLIIYLFGILLIYFGYFFNTCYICDLSFILLLGLWFSIFLLVYGLFLKPIYSLYAWVIFFLFFPKKEIGFEYSSSIFGNIFNLEDSHQFLDNLSLFEVLEFGILISICLTLIRTKNLLKLDKFELSIVLMILYGLSFLIFKIETLGLISFYKSIVQIFAAFILYKSVVFIKTKKELDFIFRLFILFAVILFFENIIGRSHLLPDQLKYYIFNYRNAYRSILVSNDLLVSLIMIISAFICLYYYKINKSYIYLFLFLIPNYLIIDTFNRAPLFSLVIFITVFAIRYFELSKYIVYCLCLYYVLFPLSSYLSPSKLPIWHIYAIENDISINKAFDLFKNKYFSSDQCLNEQMSDYYKNQIVNQKKISRGLYWGNNPENNKKTCSDGFAIINYNLDRHGGYFSTESVFARLGATYRGLDVLIHTNFLGSGPGQSKNLMSDSSILSFSEKFIFDDQSDIISFYNSIKSGRITNTHMLYSNLFVEYGFTFIIVFILFIKKILTLIYKTIYQKNDHMLFIVLIIILSLCTYYFFQAIPVILSIMCFLINILSKEKITCKNNLIDNEKK